MRYPKRPWKKSFRRVPSAIRCKLEEIGGSPLKAGSGQGDVAEAAPHRPPAGRGRRPVRVRQMMPLVSLAAGLDSGMAF